MQQLTSTQPTEFALILDRSGSMGGLESDTIGGFNSLIKKQWETEGTCRVTTVLFDDRYEVLHDRIDVHDVPPMTQNDYYVRGCTALYDAVGKTIHRIERGLADGDASAKVIVAIITDGLENASREYRTRQVKSMIEAKKAAGWEFLFLGANIDAVTSAADIGIGADRAANFHADADGMKVNFIAMSEAVQSYRTGRVVDADWSEDIDEDYRSRTSKR